MSSRKQATVDSSISNSQGTALLKFFPGIAMEVAITFAGRRSGREQDKSHQGAQERIEKQPGPHRPRRHRCWGKLLDILRLRAGIHRGALIIAVGDFHRLM